MTALLGHARLLLDILSIKIFVWMLGQNGTLLDSDLFFFDRYSELADYHRRKGRIAKADRLAVIAELHYRRAPDDEPPEAAAIAMPVPRPRTSTKVVSTSRVKKPSSEGSSLVPFACRVRQTRLARTLAARQDCDEFPGNPKQRNQWA
jgi:hypothetical protein